MDEILWFLFEIVFELFGDLLLEAFRALFDTFPTPATRALGTVFTCFVVGACLGLLSGVAWPDRLLPPPRTAGISLVLSPLGSGLAMQTWGAFRRERGHSTSGLATFHGGASFALGAALGRFVLVVGFA
jgi:hypothetical protein